MGFSYSKVGTFTDCPYKYKLTYVDKLEPLPDLRPTNALYIGTAVHEGIEKRSVEAALESYKSNYPELTDDHEIEMFKIQSILPKAIEVVPEGEYEYKLIGDDGFIGFIDCLVPIKEGVYDLLDFKCSNNAKGYAESGQVHVYKYYYEQLTGNKIRNMYYVMIPKEPQVLNEDWSIDKLKNHITTTFNNAEIKFVPIEYDIDKVNEFFNKRDKMFNATHYSKVYGWKCRWCPYSAYCKTNGRDTSGLKISQDVQEVSLF